MSSSCIAIITARGGSKRIPRKNIKSFLGYPIIKYPIQAAIDANCFDDIIVSTDDKEISKIAKKYGASVPFMRSTENSNDVATTTDVLIEVLDAFDKLGKDFKYFCCLYPTAALVQSSQLSEAFAKFRKSNAHTLMTVLAYEYPLYRALEMNRGRLMLHWPKYANTRTQDLPILYRDAAQFYFGRIRQFLSKKSFFHNCMPFLLSELETQDIDSYEDWKLAELKYEYLQSQVKR